MVFWVHRVAARRHCCHVSSAENVLTTERFGFWVESQEPEVSYTKFRGKYFSKLKISKFLGSGVPGKRVGYMPQEIALYAEFSIKETMMYFGWIFGMQTSEIIERLHFLLNFLDLPSENRLVKNLSGGQQRRVSFAVALMHDPELLILDEPTVGVDPLLRQSIWNHLVHITKAGQKTVIITTHYIEEARQAHTVSS